MNQDDCGEYKVMSYDATWDNGYDNQGSPDPGANRRSRIGKVFLTLKLRAPCSQADTDRGLGMPE